MDPTPQVPQSAPAAPTGEYEFNEAQSRVIDTLAGAMRWATLPLYLLGVAGAAAAAVYVVLALDRRQTEHWWPALVGALLAVVCFCLGRCLARSAAAFDRVTSTTNWDITHLMAGLWHLQVFFGALRLAVQVLLLLAVVAAVVFLAAQFERPTAQ